MRDNIVGAEILLKNGVNLRKSDMEIAKKVGKPHILETLAKYSIWSNPHEQEGVGTTPLTSRWPFFPLTELSFLFLFALWQYFPLETAQKELIRESDNLKVEVSRRLPMEKILERVLLDTEKDYLYKNCFFGKRTNLST